MQTIFVILALVIADSPKAARSREVTATRLDGTAIAGELRAWTGDEVVILRADQEVRLPAEELVSLRWLPPSLPGSKGSTGGFVELTDGTILPAKDFEVAAAMANVALDAPLPEDQKTIRLPVRQVTAVRLQSLEAAAEEQWNETRAQDLASDVLVVMKRDGKSLDYVEGILGNVTPTKINFLLEGEQVRVDRAKVAGLIYYRKNELPKSEPRCVVHGRMGLRAAAAQLRLTDETVQITTAGGVRLAWPLVDFLFADFSAGKIVYLSDLEPASQRWTPLVGLPAEAELAAQYGLPRRDQSAFGGRLTLRSGESDRSLSHSKTFDKGLAIRSRTELMYRLPPGFRQFVALAGIDAATSATGDVRLVIHGDDQPLFEADVAGDRPPREIELDVSGVKRLKILVDFGQNLDTGDWLNLCEAKLIK